MMMPYQMIDTDSAGIGLASTRTILRGEVIFSEEVLILVESKIKDSIFSWLGLQNI